MKELQGRHVVVSGGLGALGQAVVAELVAAGATCHVPAHRQPESSAQALPGVVVKGGVDLRDEAAVDAFYAEIPQLWASVHLAGGFAMSPFVDTAAAAFREQFELNTMTAVLCCRAAAKAIQRSGEGGRIVNVAARPGLNPRQGAGMLAYASSKAAVVALTEALAEELKSERILVNAIAPSTLDTAANRAAMPDADPSRWLAPQAAAAAIRQLVSPANMEISGAVLPLYARA